MTYYDVIVVGGGITGLSASLELTRLGFRVCLLEARSRLGGEIYSVKSVIDPTVKINLGAMYTHGSGEKPNVNPLTPLLKRYQIASTILDNFNSDLRDTHGKPTSLLEVQRRSRDEMNIALLKIQEAKEMPHHHPPMIADILGFTKDNNPKVNSREYWARKLITATFSENTGSTIYDLSLLNVMYEIPYRGKRKLIVGDFQKLARGLLEDAKKTGNFTYHVNSNVTHIQHDLGDKEVSVETETGDIYHAKRVLCALPLNVIKQKRVKFRPDISDDKWIALQHVKMGRQNKVFLEFRYPFWPRDLHVLYLNDPNINYWPEYLNFYHFSEGKVPALLFSVSGEGADFDRKSKEALLKQALLPLKKAYPKTFEFPTTYKVTRWDSNVYSLGSGVYCSHGCTEKHLDALSSNESDHLFFAGGFKRIKQGMPSSVEAGLEAGIEVALEIEAKFMNETKKSKRFQ